MICPSGLTEPAAGAGGMETLKLAFFLDDRFVALSVTRLFD
jgi:hypothetical protein